MNNELSKKFVDVICLNDQDGNIKPLSLIWNNNIKIPIIRVLEVCPCAAIKSGVTGIRYTCLLERNITKHLYFDHGKWYVETYKHVI